jgi:hypothetical protein
MIDQNRKEAWVSNKKHLKEEKSRYRLLLSSTGVLVLNDDNDYKNGIIWKSQEQENESLNNLNYQNFSNNNNLANYRRINRGG